jgi:enolase
MKPLSHSIYYDRKVEYLNLIEEFEKTERQKLEYFLKQTRFKSDSNFKSEYKQKQEELINLMNVYDIKHPLRGPKYEKFKALEEVFKDKILNLVSN